MDPQIAGLFVICFEEVKEYLKYYTHQKYVYKDK